MFEKYKLLKYYKKFKNSNNIQANLVYLKKIFYYKKTNNILIGGSLIDEMIEKLDIISNKINPKIIAKYVKNGEHYSIPIFGVGDNKC
jgi:hypothetical protein